MMGGAWMTLRGNKWYGAAVTAVAASLEIGAGHPQITYYFMLAMAALWLSDGIVALREKRLRDFGVRTAVLAGAGSSGRGVELRAALVHGQHSKETIRGGL